MGTPHEDVCHKDRSVTHLTRKGRDERYDLNQLRREPWMPNQDERRVIRMSWSIVSKAAERSSRQRHDTFCDPTALIVDVQKTGPILTCLQARTCLEI